MFIPQDIFCFAVPLTMLFAAVLSVVTSVSGCWWPISATAVLMAVAFWQFSRNPPNSASVIYAIIFFIILHSTCNGLFSGGISCIGVLDFGPRKKILRLCFMPLFLICRLNLSKCGESFRFFLYYVTASGCVAL